MTSTQHQTVNIYETLERGSIETHFQSIASVRRGSIVGVEALSRGVDGGDRRIPPMTLFRLAAAEGLTLELDRLCRTKAVENFLPLHAANPDLILFVNFHASAIDEVAVGERSFIELVNRLNLDPRNVAIEILESEFEDATRLRASVERNKSCGFLMVLDDVGAGYSNLDRITYVKPDIIKVDRSLVQDIHNDYYKQEVLKSLVNLSERVGGWVIVEGVELQEEAICVLDLGADMLQGFYFARPHKVESEEGIRCDLSRVKDTASRFRNYTLNRTKCDREKDEQRRAIARKIVTQLQGTDAEDFERKLSEIIGNYPLVESACIIDRSGIQITDTLRNPRLDRKNKTIIFRPPVKGTDHSLKEYYYLLMEAQIDPFETAPYVPLPSEDLCITISTSFEDAIDETFILCLHIIVTRN